jgi:dsDNA-binding SOS-regulon protein
MAKERKVFRLSYIIIVIIVETNLEKVENNDMGVGSSSITLRFRSDILNKLKHEAAQKRISLNTLATQVFTTHAEYDAYASTSGMVSIPKSLLITMMNQLEEEEVKKLSEHIAKNEMKDLTLLLRGEHNLNSFLLTIESWLRVSGFQYSYHTTDHDRIHRLVIQHEMGKRWSLYFERLFRYVFAELSLTSKPEFEVTDNVIAFKVRE